MKIERVELHLISMTLVEPFKSSVEVEFERPCVLVAVHSDGLTGWAESTAGEGPW